MSKSPKTNAFADGLIERTSSVLREIESKTMHTDKEGDQCRKKSIVCRGVSTPHFKIIPPIFKIPHPPFYLWCVLEYHPPPPPPKKKKPKTLALFLAKPPLTSANCPSPLLLDNSPYILVFCQSP